MFVAKMNEKTYTKVACPRCGKVLPIRITRLVGDLTYTLRCPECKRVTEVMLCESDTYAESL